MAAISHEKVNNVEVFRVAGTLSFNELVDTIEAYYPRISGHILWDLSAGGLGDFSEEEFNTLPLIVSRCMANRENGKNAYVSPDDKDYAMLRMYQVITRYKRLPFESNVFRGMDAALEWLC